MFKKSHIYASHMHHICIKGIDVKKALSYDSAFLSG